MTEIPEVKRAARALTRAARGGKIGSVRAIHSSLKRKLPSARARRESRRVESIERRGKHAAASS
ncbi:MAG: DNA-formamidopyrimidine glycosylase family protein [Gemmatimonadaceae bacterium]